MPETDLETTLYVEFGNKLKETREALKMTQQQLADSADLSRTSISNIESGKQRILLHQVFDFAEILNVPSAMLLPTPAVRPETSLRQSTLAKLSDNEANFVQLFLNRRSSVAHG